MCVDDEDEEDEDKAGGALHIWTTFRQNGLSEYEVTLNMSKFGRISMNQWKYRPVILLLLLLGSDLVFSGRLNLFGSWNTRSRHVNGER